MKLAEISKNGTVTNIIVVDPNAIPDWCKTWPEATEEARIGGTYADGVFTAPAQPQQVTVTNPTLSRLDFCLALLRLEILPMDECKAAARGEWPATFAAFVAGLPVAEAAEAEIRWATAQTVEYDNTLLQGLALARAGGDADAATAILDAIFGVK